MVLIPFQGDELYKNRDQILATFIAAWQAAIPDIWVGQDGNLYLMLSIESGLLEGLYLANQLALENMFIQTANLSMLQRHGEQFGVLRKAGTQSSGSLLFTGEGGIYIPTGTEVSYDPGADSDPIYFATTQDGTLPNPGSPTAPVAADAGAGAIAAGTYEYVVTFLTASGEGLPSAPSNALILAASHSVNLTAIPLGGPGTTSRKIYRSLNGGVFNLVTTIANNTATTFTDNNAAPGTQVPPAVDTSLSISLTAQAEDVGTDGNVVAGSITTLANVPDGITDVTNPAPFVGGTDQEDTDDYRQRLLGVLRSPQSGSPSDLQSWAEAVEGVESATVFPNDNLGTPTAGHVTVRIVASGNTVPSTDLINSVAAALAAQDLANITIHVAGFNAVTMTTLFAGPITVTMYAATGYNHADLVPGVQQAIVDYVNNIPVGGTLYASGIIAATLSVTGVADVAMTTPATGYSHTAAATDKFVATTADVVVN